MGTAIGAGFSSGREIALFFGDASPVNVAISSVFMSLLCALFLVAGKQKMMPKGALVKLGVFLAASISLCAMLAGGDFITYSMTGIPLAFGLAMTLLAGLIVVLGIEKIRLLNAILVPLIVLTIALVFAKLPTPIHTLPFSISKPIMYSGLDVLLGGIIVSEEGENLTYKEIIISCVLICIFMFGMLYMLQTIVLSDQNASLMPVLAISDKLNVKWACGVLIAAAIFTTLVSSLKIVSDCVRDFSSKFAFSRALCKDENKSLAVFGCLVVAYPLSFFGFDNIVDNLYPFNSVCGVALTCLVLVKYLAKLASVIAKKAKEKHARKRAGNIELSDKSLCVHAKQVSGSDNRSRHRHSHSHDDGNRSRRRNRSRHRHIRRNRNLLRHHSCGYAR